MTVDHRPEYKKNWYRKQNWTKVLYDEEGQRYYVSPKHFALAKEVDEQFKTETKSGE